MKRFVFFLFFLFFFISCSQDTKDWVINLNDNVYWAETTKASTIDYSSKLDFKRLNKFYKGNLSTLIANCETYVWIKIPFTIPPKLKNKDLGLVLPYIHFSEETYLNGIFIGRYGRFEPREISPQYQCHYYNLQQNLLKPNENTLMIKIRCKGRSSLCGNLEIKESQEAKEEADRKTFMNSRINMFFEGGMFCAFMLYLLLFISRQKQKENLYFSLINLGTMFFLTIFFGPEVPWYQDNIVSYENFLKITFCFPLIINTFTQTKFAIHFLHIKQYKILSYVQTGLLIIQSLIIILAPTYESIRKIRLIIILLCLAQSSIGAFYIVKEYFIKAKRKYINTYLLCHIPFLSCFIIDCSINYFNPKLTLPYFTIFGFQLTIINFLVLLSKRYNTVYNRIEYLNTELEQEIKNKTNDLESTNEKLQSELNKSEKDLEMASIIQQKFLPIPKGAFRGWEIAMTYKPSTKISGDMFDFFNENEELYGLALFDVSGKGIASSLITMLAKNIINHTFMKNFKRCNGVQEILNKINTSIIEEKGDIDNYLTGLLLKFNEGINETKIELCNASHPYPILYDSRKDMIIELIHNEAQKQYGAIGMKNVETSFPVVNFKMQEDDILVLFTDGLIESSNRKGETFGKETIENIIKENALKSSKEILKIIKDAEANFRQENKRLDDYTIIVMKRMNDDEYDESSYD